MNQVILLAEWFFFGAAALHRLNVGDVSIRLWRKPAIVTTFVSVQQKSTMGLA